MQRILLAACALGLGGTALRLASLLVPPALTCVAGEAGDRQNVVYFGNSFLENSVPWFHPTLAKSAGCEMTVRTHIGPGWQIWMHVDTFRKNPEWAKENLIEGDWTAVVIQHFGAHPLLKDNVRKTVFHNQEPFPEPRDVSDLASAAAIIDTFLAGRPDRGRAFIYSSWPGIPDAGDFMRRVKEESEKSLAAEGLPREEILKRLKERKPTLEEMAPLMRTYDFGAEWLARYEPNREAPWTSKHAHSRDYVWKLMDELKARYPKLWEQGRLALIPHGDVFLALDGKMRAGQVPGVENIGFFSRDGGHVRAGLPRYALAATCFAVLFGRHPKALDYAVYNDLENYQNANVNKMPGKIGPGYVHGPDLGELLEITPERAKVVHETIWEVVTQNPYTPLASR
jgi:hypothetical protein